MPELTPPDPALRPSFLAAVAEYTARADRPGDSTDIMARELRERGEQWRTRDGFVRYVRELGADARDDSPRPSGWVPATTRWWTDGPEYLGSITIRHRLTDRLREVGGHIGYDVRPSARRRGHATAMLRAALPVARALGIDTALITCDVDNVASRRVIEANGGVLEDERAGKLRFWVPTQSDQGRSR